MKVLVLNGSPKKNSNTMMLTHAFLRGLNAEEKHEIQVVSVIEKDIGFCRGCLSCWFRQDGHCVIQDDMNDILDDIIASDVILWSFPLYYHGIPAPLKAVLDRTNPFLKIDMRMESGAAVHDTVVDLSAKKNIVITGCGFPYDPRNFAPLKMQMEMILGKPMMICVYETTLLTLPLPTIDPLKQRLLAAFTEAGKEFSREGSIAQDTLRKLEEPMLPNERYIQIINHLKKENG